MSRFRQPSRGYGEPPSNFERRGYDFWNTASALVAILTAASTLFTEQPNHRRFAFLVALAGAAAGLVNGINALAAKAIRRQHSGWYAVGGFFAGGLCLGVAVLIYLRSQ